MLAVYVEGFHPDDPLAGLVVGERPEPEAREGWETVTLRAASINHHDIWSLRGIALAKEHLPMILGCDLAGVDSTGRAVVAHAVVDGYTMLSESPQGTMSERVSVPSENLLPKPAELSFEEASCLPTAWLTAYTMLFEKAALRPGDTVLVQGAAGGLSSALVGLGAAAGLRVWVTSRSEDKRALAIDQGADAAFPVGARLPARVDAVMDSVGAATWPHSLKCLRPGGALVVAGATAGYQATADVGRIFANDLRILGARMGTREGLRKLLSFCALRDLRPRVDRTLPLQEARDGFGAMLTGDVRGKIVLTA